jgi:hypothetical protein
MGKNGGTQMLARRPLRGAWYALAAVLLLAELAVLSLVFVPHVSPAYSAFYIRQNTDCLLAEGRPLVEIGRTVGSTGRFALTACTIDAGWLRPRPEGTTLRGAAGNLHFRLRAAPDGDLRLSFVAVAAGRQPPPTVSVLANGRALGAVRLSRNTTAVHSLIVPRAAIDGDRLTLTLALEADGRPRARRLTLLRWRLDPADMPPLTAMGPPGYY